MNLLLVDDEVLTLEALKLQVLDLPLSFSSIGTCYDVESAKEYIESHPVSLLICDIEMPGESGFDLLQWIQDHGKMITSILLTCHADFQYATAGIRYHVFDYLLKPVSSDQLLTTLQRAIAFTFDQRQLHKKRQELSSEYSDSSDRSSLSDTIAQIAAMIEEHPEKNYSRKELASHFFLNPDYLAKCFKREIGQSLPDFLLKKRIEKA
ncbi:MAG: response regulator [Lachnospiraceae bacterium]|nr:response regulator [Lachnospiraceae bacterium]